MAELIGIGIAFLGIWGSLWYKLGKLTTEVKHHNLVLAEMRKAIEKILLR